MPPSPPPASPDEAAASSSDEEDISLSSSPSLSADASSGSDASSSEGSEPGGAKKTRRTGTGTGRAWPAADDLALVEVLAEHRKMHGRLSSPGDLVAALRGRLQTQTQVDAEQVARRVHSLRCRYAAAARRISHGIVPVTDDDLKIYKLSKLIWEATRTGKTKPRASTAHHERRKLGQLEALYPCLAAEVDAIETRQPCSAAGLLKMAFGRIGDQKATELEAKLKKQRLAELKVSTQLGTLRNEVAHTLLELIE